MASYPIPPWLVPAQTADQYTRGTQIGAQVGSANAARAMEAQQFAARMQAQQTMAAAEAERADREYALRKAQADAEMAIRQQTAGRLAELQTIRLRGIEGLRTDLAAGMEPAKAYAKHWADLNAGESMAGFGPMFREAYPETNKPIETKFFGKDALLNPKTGSVTFAPQAAEEEIKTWPGTNVQYLRTAKGAIHILPNQELSVMDKTRIMSAISKMRSELGIMPKDTDEFKQQAEMIKSLESELKGVTAKPTTTQPEAAKPSVPIAEARKQAWDAINGVNGPKKDPLAVRAKFRELYGEEL